MYAFGVLVSVGLPFVFRSWTLFVTLVVALIVCGMFMLALAIYQAVRR
ncbi:hypothetical protein [Rubrobacter aplysinae]|nr:hypothetical protein [Rubrobacter aplysinae]